MSVCLSTKILNTNFAPLGHLLAHTPQEECMAYQGYQMSPKFGNPDRPYTLGCPKIKKCSRKNPLF